MQNTIDSLDFFRDKDICSVESIKTRFSGNHLWRVMTWDDVYAVRQVGRGDGNVADEFRIVRVSALVGVAPQVYCFDLQQSILVTEWIDGKHKDTLGADNLIELVGLLKRLHSIKVPDGDLLPVDLHSIVKKEEGICEAFDICEKYPSQTVLCHNDPNSQNIIWHEDGVKMIDYEYARPNDVYFDLAGVCVEFGLSEVGERLLLDEYWGEEDCLPDKLYAFKVIYEALRRQWMDSQKFAISHFWI